MKLAFISSAVLLAATVVSAAQPTSVRRVVNETSEVTGAHGGTQSLTAELADGGTLEMKWIQGGVLITIRTENRDDIESSVQSVSNQEAANLKTLIRNSKQCPVDLTLQGTEIISATSACGKN